MEKANEELLAALHNQVAHKLLERIQSPEATASDFAQAIKFLKDNEITCDVRASTGLQALKDAIEIPFFDKDDDKAASIG